MTAATTEEPRPGRGDETRRRILEAAMALYARRGVKGTGLAAIGQAAGVTHAGVLYHFGSSRRLLLAVLDERDRRFWRETAADWEGRGGLDALRQMPRLARWNRDNWELAKLYTVLEAENLDPDDEAHRYFVERRRRVRRRIEGAIEEGQRRGEIRPGHPRALAVAFWGALQGIAEVLVWHPRGPVPRAGDVVGLLRPDPVALTARRSASGAERARGRGPRTSAGAPSPGGRRPTSGATRPSRR